MRSFASGDRDFDHPDPGACRKKGEQLPRLQESRPGASSRRARPRNRGPTAPPARSRRFARAPTPRGRRARPRPPPARGPASRRARPARGGRSSAKASRAATRGAQRREAAAGCGLGASRPSTATGAARRSGAPTRRARGPSRPPGARRARRARRRGSREGRWRHRRRSTSITASRWRGHPVDGGVGRAGQGQPLRADLVVERVPFRRRSPAASAAVGTRSGAPPGCAAGGCRGRRRSRPPPGGPAAVSQNRRCGAQVVPPVMPRQRRGRGEGGVELVEAVDDRVGAGRLAAGRGGGSPRRRRRWRGRRRGPWRCRTRCRRPSPPAPRRSRSPPARSSSIDGMRLRGWASAVWAVTKKRPSPCAANTWSSPRRALPVATPRSVPGVGREPLERGERAGIERRQRRRRRARRGSCVAVVLGERAGSRIRADAAPAPPSPAAGRGRRRQARPRGREADGRPRSNAKPPWRRGSGAGCRSACRRRRRSPASRAVIASSVAAVDRAERAGEVVAEAGEGPGGGLARRGRSARSPSPAGRGPAAPSARASRSRRFARLRATALPTFLEQVNPTRIASGGSSGPRRRACRFRPGRDCRRARAAARKSARRVRVTSRGTAAGLGHGPRGAVRPTGACGRGRGAG